VTDEKTNKDSSKGSTKSTTSERTVPVRYVLITGGVGVVLALIAFLVGLLSGRAALTEQAEAHEAELVERRQELSRAVDELATQRARGHLLQARAAIYRAASDLDRRNFGLANQSIEEAAQALAATEAAPLGIEAGDLAEVHAQVEGLRLEVAADLEEQRTRLLDAAARLDRLIQRKKEAAEAAAP
jgi:hypothetical protein